MTIPSQPSAHRILIVDDNDSIHEDFRKVLGSASGKPTSLDEMHVGLFGVEHGANLGVAFEIDSVFQGQEGLARVRAARAEGRPYAVAFVDGRMPPGWDGIETIGHLWQEDPDLQIVFCSAYSDHGWNEIRRTLGQTDSLLILKKPFDNVEVLQLAHTLTTKWELSRQVKRRLDDLGREVRTRTQEKLEALALLEVALEQSPSGIVIAEAPNLSVRWENAAAAGIRGAPGPRDAETQTDPPFEPWHAFREDGSPYLLHEQPLARAVLKGETTRNEEFVIRNAEGKERCMSVNAAPVRDAHGVVTAGIGVFDDITERKRTEREREELQARFVQAQKMESVGRLAGGVAHDFNNMLQAILGYVDLALMDIAKPKVLMEELLEIRKAAQRSADLTRQLLAFSRKQTSCPEILDLNERIASLLTILRRMIGEEVQVVWVPADHIWPVKIDPSQVDQILANLCVNSRDAIAGVGRIIIETTNLTVTDSAPRSGGNAAGDYVMLAVADTSCGIDADTRSHIFEPFFTTKEPGKGTGLGLATVFGIVQQNGGFIEVESKPGCGATFQIHLPRSEALATNPDQISEHLTSSGDATVLLVEDELQVRNLATRVLSQRGYAVLTASSPQVALDLVAGGAGPIDLLVTDVMMPGMNGKQLYQRLQATLPALKCLFISGYTADIIAEKGVLEPGLHYLQKPFTNEGLARKVQQVLDAP